MPYSIPSSIKVLIYFGNSTIFVHFSWHPLWICYEARSVYFTVSLGRKGTLFFLHIQLHNHQKDLNPCLWLYYYGKVIVELEKTQTTKEDKLFMLVIWPSSTYKRIQDTASLPVPLFLVVLHRIRIYISKYHFYNFLNLIQHLQKNIFHEFSFFNRFTRTPHPLKG